MYIFAKSPKSCTCITRVGASNGCLGYSLVLWNRATAGCADYHSPPNPVAHPSTHTAHTYGAHTHIHTEIRTPSRRDASPRPRESAQLSAPAYGRIKKVGMVEMELGWDGMLRIETSKNKISNGGGVFFSAQVLGLAISFALC